MRRHAVLVCAALLAAPIVARSAEVLQVECARDARHCPRIEIAGDRLGAAPTFTGRADPSLFADPAVNGRLWMLYSHLEGRRARGAQGNTVGVPHVATRLARSDDGGKHFALLKTLWDSELVEDPEGRGPPSYFGSESTGLVARRDETGTIWYSVRLTYFLEPVTAYAPRYATSWTVRVAAVRGETPEALSGAEESVLGSTTTHAAYGPQVRLNALAPALRDCALWNNPALAVDSGRLYLLVECMVFEGKRPSNARSRIVVFRTSAVGAPREWQWEYVGVLADATVARALGGERLVSPNVSRGADGAPLLTMTPQVNGIGQGCVVVQLESIDPPRVRQNDGQPVIRARLTSDNSRRWHTGACTHDAASATGLITVAATTAKGLQAELRATGLRP